MNCANVVSMTHIYLQRGREEHTYSRKLVYVLTLRKAWPQLAKQEQYNLQCVPAHIDHSVRSYTSKQHTMINSNKCFMWTLLWMRQDCLCCCVFDEKSLHTLSHIHTNDSIVCDMVGGGIGVTVSQMIRAWCLTADTLRTVPLLSRTHCICCADWQHSWVCTQCWEKSIELSLLSLYFTLAQMILFWGFYCGGVAVVAILN